MLLEELNDQSLEMSIITLTHHVYVQNFGHLQVPDKIIPLL